MSCSDPAAGNTNRRRAARRAGTARKEPQARLGRRHASDQTTKRGCRELSALPLALPSRITYDVLDSQRLQVHHLQLVALRQQFLNNAITLALQQPNH